MIRRTARSTLPILLTATLCLGASETSKLDYPEARRVEQVDVYNGVKVSDPYRWMEEDDSEEIRAWVKSQGKLLENYTSRVGIHDAIRRRLEEVRGGSTYSIPTPAGEREFFTTSRPDRDQSVLMMRAGRDAEPVLIFDPEEAITEEGFRFGGFSVSRDGKHVAVVSSVQARWGRIRVLRVADRKELPDRIDGISAAPTWSADGSGFFYISYGKMDDLLAGRGEPRARLLFHKLGTDSARDKVMFEDRARPELLFTTQLSNDGRYFVLGLFNKSRNKNQLAYIDLDADQPQVKLLIDEADAGYTYEASVDDLFFVQTDLDAPRGRVMTISLRNPARESWKELIPQRTGAIGAVSHIGHRLVVRSVEDAMPVVEIFGMDGKLQRRLELPTIGLVGGFADTPDSRHALFRMNNLFDLGTIYEADLTTGKSRVALRPDSPFNPDDFVIRQEFFTNAEGMRVPILVSHKRGLKKDGTAPAYMYAYGHGGWQAAPWFQPHLLVFMEMGGVYALPGIRGGGEYGLEWQEAGTRRNKPNTISDYIAAAEWLVKQRYTSKARLVANGGSASGILPAVAVVQRPDLFGAAVIDFPFLDMYRYHRFTTFKGWIGGYGTSDDAEDFAVLRKYSPLHNLEKGSCYPAVLTIVGEEDSTTVPMHGYKFTAALQDAQSCPRPALLKEVPGAGHYSYGLTRKESVKTEAEILAFLIRSLAWEPRLDALPPTAAAERRAKKSD